MSDSFVVFWMVAHQAPLFIRSSRQEYWMGGHSHLQGIFPTKGWNLSLLREFSSVTQSCPILWPRGLQDDRIPCPPTAPEACSNSCPSSWWCHPTISSSLVPFSSCFQSFPALGPFPMSQFFIPGGQNIGCFSFSISPSNEYSELISIRIDWFDLLALQGTLWSLLQQQSRSINYLALTHMYDPTLTWIHDYWKNHSFD